MIPGFASPTCSHPITCCSSHQAKPSQSHPNERNQQLQPFLFSPCSNSHDSLPISIGKLATWQSVRLKRFHLFSPPRSVQYSTASSSKGSKDRETSEHQCSAHHKVAIIEIKKAQRLLTGTNHPEFPLTCQQGRTQATCRDARVASSNTTYRPRPGLVLNFFFELSTFSSHQNFSTHINFQYFHHIVPISTKLSMAGFGSNCNFNVN